MRIIGICMLCVCLVTGTVTAMPVENGGLTQLSEHVYAYVGITNASPSANGFGANSGVVIGDDAVLVIDTRVSATEARRLIADIRTVTDKPIAYAVNTHYHLDHAWGNSEFVKLGAVVIGQENAALHTADVEHGILHAEEAGMTAEDMAGIVMSMPTVTFTDSKVIDLGGVTVTLTYPGPSHTNDSIMVMVDPDAVLFTGDIMFTGYHPFLGEGDLPSWKTILAGLETTTARVIVPGHGPVSTVDDLKNMSAYLTAFDQQATALCTGKTAADAPAIAQELLATLPEQHRTELLGLVEMNLRTKYLPQPETTAARS